MDQTTFTKDEAKAMREELTAALAPILAARHLTVTRVSATYGDVLSVKVEFGREGVDPAAVTFQRYAEYMGIPVTSLGSVITSRGKRFTVTGLNPRARTMPVLAKGEDGRTYKFPVAALKRALGLPVNPWDER